MNQRSLTALAAIAAVLLLGVLLLDNGDSRDNSGADRVLLPGLRDELNDVTRVTVSSSNDSASIERRDETWVVTEKSAYPADPARLRDALLALADAVTLEAKTANPERLAQLGLDEASATAVDILTGGREYAVLLGNVAQQRYRYARLRGEDQSWLIDQNPDFAPEPSDWLRDDLLDIASSEIEQVTVLHADGEEISLAASEGGQFTVENIPAGRDLRYASVANGIAGGLQALALEDVKPADAVSVGADLTTTFVTRDGLTVAARRYSEDEQAWFSFEAVANTEPALPDSLADGEVDVDSASGSPAERAAEINRRLDGWVYRLPEYKANALTKRWPDLLAAVPDDDQE